MAIGICFKCGNEREVRQHHYKGYITDETKPYCFSCDRKAHNKARKEGKCKLTPKEVNRLSIISSHLRNNLVLNVSQETLIPNVRLIEQIQYGINTGSVYCNTYFCVGHNKRLYEVNI